MARIAFKYGSKRYYIAQYAERGVKWTDCYYELREKVLKQEKPWIFTANTGAAYGPKRSPKLMGEQLKDLKDEVRRVYALLNRAADDADVDTSGDEIPEPTPSPEPEPKPEPAKPRDKAENEKLFFYQEWKRVREWIHSRVASTGASPIDSLDSMRPLIEAERGIDAGISAKAMLSAMTLHWGRDSRADAGIQEIDFADEADRDLLDETHHKLTSYVTKLAEARIPIMLVGPSGTGKSKVLRKIAEEIMEVPYGETPMSAGATPSWLLGRMTFPDGSAAKIDIPDAADMDELMKMLVEAVAALRDTTSYKISHFLKIFTGGGIFLFDEIDAADANMLLVTNNALALKPGEVFFNPVNGEEYVKSPDFIPAAAGNTYGIGADRKYTGRERLDFATLDRFRMGRCYFDLDEDLARSMILGK